MNLLDANVTKIISNEPKYKYNKYWIRVEYECYGQHSLTDLMFNSEEEALSLKVGFKFLV